MHAVMEEKTDSPKARWGTFLTQVTSVAFSVEYVSDEWNKRQV